MHEQGWTTADLAVLTVLPEEYAAVLACLSYGTTFTAAIGMGTPKTTFGALAATQVIAIVDGPSRARTGMIASCDKVIDDPDEAFLDAVCAAWPQLLAVEMEDAGGAAAVHEIQAQHAVGFILVRGICDMPHRKVLGASASTAERDGWKVTASRNAALPNAPGREVGCRCNRSNVTKGISS